MYANNLYAKAFRFREAKPWTQLSETDYFLLRAESGITYTCIVMGGSLGNHKALAMYPGEEGFLSLLRLAHSNPEEMKKDPYLLVSQCCIQCSIESEEDNVPEIVLREEKNYGKVNGLKVNAKVGYVSFMECQPEYLPSDLNPKNQKDLIEGLEALQFLLEKLAVHSAEELGFGRDHELPLLYRQEGVFQMEIAPMTGAEESKLYPVGEMDEFNAKVIKDHPKSSAVSMRVTYVPTPVEDPETKRAMFPAALLVIGHRDGAIYPVMPECSYLAHPEEYVAGLREAFDQLKCYPRYINVDDDRTERLLSQFSKMTGIPLMRVHKLDDIDEVLENFYEELDRPLTEEELNMFDEEEFMDEEEVKNLETMISSLADDEIRNMPLDLKQELLNLTKTPFLQPETKKRLKSLL